MTALVMLGLIVVVGLVVIAALSDGTIRRTRYMNDEDDTSYQVGNRVGGDLAGRNVTKSKSSTEPRVVSSSATPATTQRRTGAGADYVADDSASFLAAAVLMDSMNQPIPTYQQPTETPAPTPEACTPSTSESSGSSCDTGSSSSHDSGSSSSYGGSSYDSGGSYGGGSYDSGGSGDCGGGSDGGGCD